MPPRKGCPGAPLLRPGWRRKKMAPRHLLFPSSSATPQAFPLHSPRIVHPTRGPETLAPVSPIHPAGGGKDEWRRPVEEAQLLDRGIHAPGGARPPASGHGRSWSTPSARSTTTTPVFSPSRSYTVLLKDLETLPIILTTPEAGSADELTPTEKTWFNIMIEELQPAGYALLLSMIISTCNKCHSRHFA